METVVDVLPLADGCDVTTAPEVTPVCAKPCREANAAAGHLSNGQAEDLSSLVKMARRHDEAAACLLMERLYPRVVKIVRGHLPSRMAEEDLVQMIFIKVFNNLHQYEGRVPFEHWVSRIAVNTCFSALKAEKARPEYRWADLSEEQQHVVESLAAQAVQGQDGLGGEARELLQLLMSRLNPPERLVVNLLHLEEKSVAEVRDLTGWSAPLVKVRAFRARKKLQRWLRQLEKKQ